jgi:hypothetical protein
MLGLTRDDAVSEFSAPSLEAVLRRTRGQLLDCARYLGLTGIHRLRKDALATRFLQALRGPTASGSSSSAGRRPRPSSSSVSSRTRATSSGPHGPAVRTSRATSGRPPAESNGATSLIAPPFTLGVLRGAWGWTRGAIRDAAPRQARRHRRGPRGCPLCSHVREGRSQGRAICGTLAVRATAPYLARDVLGVISCASPGST